MYQLTKEILIMEILLKKLIYSQFFFYYSINWIFILRDRRMIINFIWRFNGKWEIMAIDHQTANYKLLKLMAEINIIAIYIEFI